MPAMATADPTALFCRAWLNRMPSKALVARASQRLNTGVIGAWQSASKIRRKTVAGQANAPDQLNQGQAIEQGLARNCQPVA